MKTLLLVFGLYCQYILTAHLESHQNDLNDDKTSFETLSDGPVHEIVNHLDDKDKISFSKTTKDYLKYDPRKVVLNLPLRNSKEPSPFLCEQLKTRKKLVINMKYDKKGHDLFDFNTIEMNYLHCLSGIEDLVLGYLIEKTKILNLPNFNIRELFPYLKQLELSKVDQETNLDAIPDDLKSFLFSYEVTYDNEKEIIKMKNTFKEKIMKMKQLEFLTLGIWDKSESISSTFNQMIPELVNLPNFKRLKINYLGYLASITDILSQTKQADYILELHGSFKNNYPDTEETQKFCNILSVSNHLKILHLVPDHKYMNFDCLLESLPSSLTDFEYDAILRNTKVEKINLPKSLRSAHLTWIHSNVFVAFANQVQFLQAKISHPDNFMTIEKPFTKVETLIYEDILYCFNVEFWLHFLKLLPMHMKSVNLKIVLPGLNDFDILEKKILSFGKRIKQFKLIVRYLKDPYNFASAQYFEGTYVFDGTKMIKQD